MEHGGFSTAQKEYLDGFLRGLAQPARPQAAPEVSTADLAPGKRAQLAWLAAGKRLSKEEQIKFDGDPLDAWARIEELSAAGALPEGEDIFRFKFHGLWNVSPAQKSMMCRLRIPGGVLKAYQAEAVAEAARRFGGDYVDVTTRANLQIREIPGRHMADLLTALHEAGIIPRGSGADNIRNVTGNPTCGIDPGEIIDVLPLCRQLHHRILHDRTLYGLPRKFNIAFDGGNSISALEDTNDIGFKAVRVEAGKGVEPGVYFRVALGGITGHGDFARDTGLLLKPDECIPVAEAMVRVYVMNGDRGSRKKARLKYVLDAWGIPKFLEETQRLLPFPLLRLAPEACRFAPPADKAAHLGIRPQRQPGLCYLGVAVPAGRLTAAQLSGLAALAVRFGSGTLRLTVWQNLLVSDVPEERLGEALAALAELGLSHEPDFIQAGLVACTGSEGCKFGMAATKSTSQAIAAHLKGRVALDAPINIHLTGCPHSCAQHFIGDIGLLAVSVDKPGYRGGGFHVFVGGGFGAQARIGIPVRRFVPAPEAPAEVESLLRTYLEKRRSGETFTEFTARHSDAEIATLFGAAEASPALSLAPAQGAAA
jgi:ferredoxin-nitrite reductase